MIPGTHVCVCEGCADKVTFSSHIGTQFIKTVKEEVQVLNITVSEKRMSNLSKFCFASFSLARVQFTHTHTHTHTHINTLIEGHLDILRLDHAGF